MNDLGQKIACLRKEKKLSQEELAEKLDVSRQAISKWERNESLPDVYNLVNIADALDVSLDLLIHKEKQASENRFQKIPLLLMGIPIFLFSMAWIYGLFIILGTSIGLIISFFDLSNVFEDVYTRMFIAIFGSVLLYIYLTCYKNMFTANKVYKSYAGFLIINAMLLVGHVLVLAFVYLNSFSTIFLYILVLLILISGIVGVLLYDVKKEEKERYPKFNMIYKKFDKPLKIIYIVMFMFTLISIFQQEVLITKYGYVDEMTLISDDFTENMFFLKTYNQEERDALGNTGSINVTRKFHVELEEEPMIKVYVEGKLFIEGKMTDQGNQLYRFNLDQIESKIPLLIIDEHSSNNHLDIQIEIYWVFNGQEMKSIEDIEYSHYQISYDYENAWIWSINKYKEENIIIR